MDAVKTSLLARRSGVPEGLRGPFPDVAFMPTGGVSVANISDWLAAGQRWAPVASCLTGHGHRALGRDRGHGPRVRCRVPVGKQRQTMTAGPRDIESGRGDGSYMGFVGVATGTSSIRKVFPLWADALGLPTRTLRGHDIALASPPQTYREVVAEIRDDPQHRGALVTTHKMAVFSSARDMFDHLDELALTFGESLVDRQAR